MKLTWLKRKQVRKNPEIRTLDLVLEKQQSARTQLQKIKTFDQKSNEQTFLSKNQRI